VQTSTTKIYDLLAGYDNVEYCLTPCDEARDKIIAEVTSPTTCVVKAALVQNSEVEQDALLHVLVPSTHIIGLDNLNLLIGGNYEAFSAHQQEELLLTENLINVPSIPRWQLVELNKRSFSKLVARCLRADIASPVPALQNHADNDEKAIRDSVSQFTKRRIKQRLEETLELPPIPRTTQKIIALRANPDADISDLSQAVEIDPSLAAQVVSWASSPYYSAPGEIKSVHDAIVRVLGFDMVLNMALGLTLGKSMSMNTLSASEVQEYWREAVLVASTTEALVMAIPAEKRPERGLAYLAGLLSNFGTLVMSEVFPLYHKQIKRIHAANPHCDQSEIELYALGTCGQQIGSWLLNQWSMPKPVSEAIRQSAMAIEDPTIGDYARLILLAKGLLSEAGILPSERTNNSEKLLEELEIDAQKAAIVIERIQELEQEFISFSGALA